MLLVGMLFVCMLACTCAGRVVVLSDTCLRFTAEEVKGLTSMLKV